MADGAGRRAQGSGAPVVFRRVDPVLRRLVTAPTHDTTHPPNTAEARLFTVF
jgi:hypothetical protein